MGKAGLEDRITSLKEEVGQLELDLDKGSKDNAASIDKLQKELNATADQFPDQVPLRTEDEQKLKAKINKIEDQINDTHQKILAHGDVSERARSELEVLSQKAASCKCKDSSNSKKVSFLQTEGSQPRHLSEEEIAAMVNDLPGLTLDVATQTDVSAVEGAFEDESVAIEALVRKAEELERQREGLQAQLQRDARRFREARSKLLDQSKVASRELYAAKIQAVREEEAAKKRERMLGKQETYATTMLKQQAAKLENLNKQIADYGTRIKQLSDFLKTCGCVAKDALVWMPPAKVSTATTNVTRNATALENSQSWSSLAPTNVGQIQGGQTVGCPCKKKQAFQNGRIKYAHIASRIFTHFGVWSSGWFLSKPEKGKGC